MTKSRYSDEERSQLLQNLDPVYAKTFSTLSPEEQENILAMLEGIQLDPFSFGYLAPQSNVITAGEPMSTPGKDYVSNSD